MVRAARSYTSAGKLVPDSLVLKLVAAAVQSNPACQSNGWLLDGFPRTSVQADAMASMGLVPDLFLLIDVPDSVLEDRICNRRTDPATGAIYNLKFKPPPAALLASGTLIQRDDDTKVHPPHLGRNRRSCRRCRCYVLMRLLPLPLPLPRCRCRCCCR
jgi:adenylate kinase